MPLGIKVIAALSIAGGLLNLLLGTMLIGVDAYGKYLYSSSQIAAMPPALTSVGGVLYLGLGVVALATGIGLLRRRRWAWRLVWISNFFSLILPLIGLVSGDLRQIWNMIVPAIVLGYLTFAKDVKAAFERA